MCLNGLTGALGKMIVYSRFMDASLITAGMPVSAMLLACGVALLAAFVKGTVGFALPMIMISGLGSFLSPELALAGLILPTLVTNFLQAFRDGARAALASARKIRLFLVIGSVCLLASAQLVRSIDESVIFALIGLPIILFGAYQLAGLRLTIPPERQRISEVVLGGFAGLVGGISGIWGPPLVAYLTGLNTPKGEQVRIQGVAFGLGALLLLAAHLQTGVMNDRTIQFSALLVPPALLGTWLGRRAHDRMDQETFRRVTLVVLIIAGLNLLRRAFF